MINTKLKAKKSEVLGSRGINLINVDGDCVASFSGPEFFYVVTGFKSVEDYNDHHDAQPVKFLQWKRKH